MAKDTRGAKTKTPKSGKKRKLKPKHILAIALAVFTVLLAVFVVIAVKNYNNRELQKDLQLSAVNKLVTTPLAAQGKVAYYMFGILGEDMENDPMVHLSMVRYDKTAKTVRVLEVPQTTYLGDDEKWIVKTSGEVWANPTPMTFCDYDKKYISDEQAEECRSKAHTVTEKEGSSSYNVGLIFNAMALPVDGYFIFSQEAFIDLVDNLGGVDVDLEKAQTLGGIDYRDGIRTLDGAGALEYAIKQEKKDIAGELDSIVRRRKVFTAVWQRLTKQSKDELTSKSIGNVMYNGSRIFFGLYNEKKAMIDKATTEQVVTLIQAMSSIKLENMTAQILPGEKATHDSVSYYSIHRAELIALLNKEFSIPGENKVTEADVQILELAADGESDTRKQALSEIAVTQTGLNEPAVDEPEDTDKNTAE